VARYDDFDRAEWAARRARSGAAGSADAAASDVGVVTAAEVVEVYGPLAELVATRARGIVPYVVAVTGSVAVGKSAAAAALATVLAHDTDRHPVAVVSTDGFLLPNAELEARDLVARKGFPESFDHDALLDFLAAVRAGDGEVRAPVYSHVTYDIVPGAWQVANRPSVVVLEGLPFPHAPVDFVVYLDAATDDIESWYLERFRALCADDGVTASPYLRVLRDASPDEITRFGGLVWAAVNLVNLEEHILPTRDGSDVILQKGPDHRIELVRVRVD
jgi:type I pantothenate kinase